MDEIVIYKFYLYIVNCYILFILMFNLLHIGYDTVYVYVYVFVCIYIYIYIYIYICIYMCVYIYI